MAYITEHWALGKGPATMGFFFPDDTFAEVVCGVQTKVELCGLHPKPRRKIDKTQDLEWINLRAFQRGELRQRAHHIRWGSEDPWSWISLETNAGELIWLFVAFARGNISNVRLEGITIKAILSDTHELSCGIIYPELGSVTRIVAPNSVQPLEVGSVQAETLARFLRTGLIEPIQRGDNKTSIETKLGPPTDWKYRCRDIFDDHDLIVDFRSSHAWHYGQLCVIFDSDGCVSGFTIYYGDYPPLPRFPAQLASFPYSPFTTDDLNRVMTRHGIEWSGDSTAGLVWIGINHNEIFSMRVDLDHSAG